MPMRFGCCVRRLRDRVAVDDDLAVVLARMQELVADPQQIVALLPLERNARADAGMDEEIVSFDVRQRQAAHELHMAARDAPADFALQSPQLALVTP